MELDALIIAIAANLGPAIDVQRLQSRVGVTTDGKWGSVTTRALQTYLNRNR